MICEFLSKVGGVFFFSFCHIKLNYKSALVLYIATHSQQANYGEGFCACRILGQMCFNYSFIFCKLNEEVGVLFLLNATDICPCESDSY